MKFDFPKSDEHSLVAKKWRATKLSDIRQKGPIDSRYYLSEQYLVTLKRHRAAHSAKGHGFGYVVRSWDGIAGTVLCSNMGRERNLVYDEDHPKVMVPHLKTMGPLNREHIRKLTPLEFCRLHGFPRDFKIDGISDSQLYKQFGNSVTVPVIEAVARQIRPILEAALGLKSE